MPNNHTGHKVYVQPQQLGLSFEDDVLGDAQEFSFYNRDKGIWLLITLATQTRAPRKLGFGTVHRISATGTIRRCAALDATGKTALQTIGEMKKEEQSYEIGRLVTKLLLPNLPSAELIVVLNRDKFKQKAAKLSSKGAVQPYDASDFEHRRIFNSFSYYGADRWVR